MTGVQVFTIIAQRILGFVGVSLFVVIFFGKVFGKSMGGDMVWVMILLILGFWVWWTIGFVRTLKFIRAARAAQHR